MCQERHWLDRRVQYAKLSRGLIIKRSDDFFDVYHKAEKSVGNYEVVSKTSFDAPHKAANYFLKFYKNSIDGIEIK